MRSSKHMLLTAIGALIIEASLNSPCIQAADPFNQISRMVGAGWSDGYHARGSNAFRLGENLPPQSHGQSPLIGSSYKRFVNDHRASTPIFGCSNCNGSSVNSYHYVPTQVGSAPQWQPSYRQSGPAWDAYLDAPIESDSSYLELGPRTDESIELTPANQDTSKPLEAVLPKPAASDEQSELLEPASPSDSNKTLPSQLKPSIDDELLESDEPDLLDSKPAAPVESKKPRKTESDSDSLLDDALESDDDLLLDPEDKSWPPDLDTRRLSPNSNEARLAAVRIPRSVDRHPQKIADSAPTKAVAKPNRPIRLPSSFR